MKLAPAEHQAVMWEVRLREGDIGASVLNEFDHWRTAEAANELAWNALQQRLSRLGGARSGDASAMAHALRTPATERRRALRAAFAMLVVGCGAWTIREGMHGMGLDADWQSGVGERGEGKLANGTALAFDANSRIYLSGSAASPRLDIKQGQVLVKSWPQRDDVVTVATAHGIVDTEGATFNVGRLEQRSVVSVSTGSALLRPQGAPPVLVSAGETFYFNHHGAQQSEMPFAAASAWLRGQLAGASLDKTLLRIAAESGVALAYDPPLVESVRSSPVNGNYSATEAIVWRYDVGGFAWDNSELSTEIWLWHYYLHSGRADAYRLAEAMTRHTDEVDVHHIGPYSPLGTRHGVQHWSDSAKQLRVSTAINRRFFYYLSADERVGDLLREQVNAVDRLRTIILGR